jgi:hypothetical protein
VLQISIALNTSAYFSFQNGQHAIEDLTKQVQTEIGNRITENLYTYLATPFQADKINAAAIAGICSVAAANPNLGIFP